MGGQRSLSTDARRNILEQCLSSLQEGQCRFLDDGKRRVLVEVTDVYRDEYLYGGILTGRCVLTGNKWVHSIWTVDAVEQVGPPICEMEVLAIVSSE